MRRSRIARVALACPALLVLLLCSHVAVAHAASVERGRAYARSHCARCHSIDRHTASPFAPAPPFRTLHERYPVESLEEALAEGIVTGHPAMPEFRLEPGQISDFIAFLKSLER
jgi:cytochrome c